MGKKFLQLIDRVFTPRNKLHKIFNRHLVKISYSCTPNMKAIITAHNSKVMTSSSTSTQTQPKTCNCQKKDECPMNGNCLQEAIIYQATVKTPTDEKIYIGSTERPFKQRYYGHKSDLTHEKKRGSTALSAYYWEQKDRGLVPNVTWKILKKCRKYVCGGKKCDVCLTEKLTILQSKDPRLLNKRSELMARCPHKRKWRLSCVEPT